MKKQDGCVGCKYKNKTDLTICEKCLTKSQTNADRIRAMSDEELANMLIQNRCKHCINENGARKCFTMWCTQGILEWLKKEVEE